MGGKGGGGSGGGANKGTGGSGNSLKGIGGGGPTMKAPGGGGSYHIPRAIFESNPRAYFKGLQAGQKSCNKWSDPIYVGKLALNKIK